MSIYCFGIALCVEVDIPRYASVMSDAGDMVPNYSLPRNSNFQTRVNGVPAEERLR